jgi:hypothetical protein
MVKVKKAAKGKIQPRRLSADQEQISASAFSRWLMQGPASCTLYARFIGESDWTGQTNVWERVIH